MPRLRRRLGTDPLSPELAHPKKPIETISLGCDTCGTTWHIGIDELNTMIQMDVEIKDPWICDRSIVARRLEGRFSSMATKALEACINPDGSLHYFGRITFSSDQMKILLGGDKGSSATIVKEEVASLASDMLKDLAQQFEIPTPTEPLSD